MLVAYDHVEKRGTNITMVDVKQRNLHVSNRYIVTEARAYDF